MMPARGAIVLSLVLAACSPADRPAIASSRSLGDTVQGSALRVGTDNITLERVLHVGQLDGPPEYALGRYVEVAPASSAGFYVCDDGIAIRLYDTSGVFVRAVGRAGSGPGEYRTCINMVVAEDGRLSVSDPSNGRIVRFAGDGSALPVIPSLTGGGLGGTGTFLLDARGRYWRKAWLPTSGDLDDGNIPAQFVILDSVGHQLDSVHVPSPGSSAGLSFALSTSEGMYHSQPVDSLHAIGPDGTIALASPARYHVLLVRADATSLELARDSGAIAYEGDELAEWRAWRNFVASKSPQDPWAPIREVKPVLRGLRIDELGRLWVKVHVRAEKRPIPPRRAGDARPLLTWRERNTYDLFDGRTGAFIGRVGLPYDTEFLASQGDLVWVREEGESGELLVGVYRMVAAGL